MTIKVVRNLNPHETYACSPKDVKRLFINECVSIDFGLLRDFRFESGIYKKYKKPYIEGTVIASASYYGKDWMDDYRDYIALILFYAIKDEKYAEKGRNTFVETYLPLMSEWYQRMLKKSPMTRLSGIEEFLIEWTNSGFTVHEFRYH